MRKFIAVYVCMLLVQVSLAQAPAEQPAPDAPQSYTLSQRYELMKTTAQSFKEYKVVKESVMDGIWKITRDTLAAKDAAIRAAKKTIDQLNAKVSLVNASLQQKEQSMAATFHASTHITVFGMDVAKNTFLTVITILVIILIAAIVVLLGKMKLLSRAVNEKKLSINMLTSEYEDYRRRAMEKHTKISRELQDERNKVNTSRNS